MELTAINIDQATKLYSYEDFKEIVVSLYNQEKVTGDNQSEPLLETTKMNLHRMKRIEKTTTLNENVLNVVKQIKGNWTWYLIMEGWCGDGSQNTPIISQIAESSSNIELKLLLRDENPEIMDRYLTNGGRAIPKLICVDNATGNELGTWGPRPVKIQEMVTSFKKENPEVDKHEFSNNLHLWYTKDKGNALQEELTGLINEWINK